MFSWDEIPGNDNERLIEFLKDKFKIEWAKTENINKTDDDKTIIVSNKDKSLLLKLNDEKTNVNIEIDDVRVNEFTVEVENGYLFSWDKIPGNDNVRLIKFLNRHFAIEWVKTAEIEKTDGDRAIKVSNGKNYLSLSLNDEKTKVYLKTDDNRTYEFIAKTENSELNIYLFYTASASFIYLFTPII